MDSLGNSLCPDNVVKCVEGRHKGRKGVIKHINKNFLFLWDKDFA
jgi:ribosomal protein L14E/L6E/L27E